MLYKLMSTIRIKFFLLLLASLSACAFGQKINYQGVSTFSPPDINGQSVIAVSDRRPYVVNGDKNPHWVGLSRALNGIPYGVHTQSGKALSDDLGSLLTSTFNKDGVIRAYQINLSVNENLETALARKAKKEDLLFFITVLEWKTDVYFNAELSYEVNLDVYNGNQSLVSNTVKGSDGLGGSNPKRLNLAVATADIFGTLINADKVVGAVKRFQSTTGGNKMSVSKSERSERQVAKDTKIDPNLKELDSVKVRMDKIKKARDQGVLTEEEYQQKRKAVVDAM